METKLTRIAEVAKARPSEKFTSLAHLINEEMIKECHKEMNKKKAAGIDEVTKEEYEMNLDVVVSVKEKAGRDLVRYVLWRRTQVNR